MTYYEYYLIFLTLIFCGYACYTDIKIQKIRNICSFGLLYVGILSQLMAWYLGKTTPLYILGLLLGSGLTVFAFYWFGVFSPGDSKLFWGLCLILPPPLFRFLDGILSFPPLILLLNIIIPYSLVTLSYLIFIFLSKPNKLKFLCKYLLDSFRKEILLKQLFNLLNLIGIGTTITYIAELFQLEINRLLQMGLVVTAFILVRRLLSRLPKTPTYYAIIGFACIWILLNVSPSITGFIYGITFFLGVYIVVFVIAKQMVLGLAMTLERNVDIENLKVGMVPAEQIVQTKHQNGVVRYEKQQAVFSSGNVNIIISPSAKGLSKEEIVKLKRLVNQKKFSKFGNKIKIQPDICFAPIISFGALLTILCQGPFYLKLIQIF